MKHLPQTTLYSTPQRQRFEHFIHLPQLLIVDRDVLFASLLQKSLEAFKYEITTASSGQAALHLLGLTRVDLVLLDPLLPDMNGYLLCAEINRLYNTPVVIMSQLNDIDKALNAFSAGVSTIVGKPFKLQELAAEIHKTLNTVGSHKECHFQALLENPDEHVLHHAYS